MKLLCGFLAGAALILVPGMAGAQPVALKTIYTFAGGADGGLPGDFLTLDGSGALYGMTREGGTSNAGTLFKLTPPAPGKTKWTHTVLYSFAGGSDGAWPFARLSSDGNGGFYGTTNQGGDSNFGTVFHLTPPAPGQTGWAHSVLYSFPANSNPDHLSYAELITAPDGTILGTTRFGGAVCDCGTAFQLTPPAPGNTSWGFTNLHDFTDADGKYPQGGLSLGENGVIYGGTYMGGATKAGVVFQLSSSGGVWSEATTFDFDGSQGGFTSGSLPTTGLTPDSTGALFAVAEGVAKVSPPSPGQSAWTSKLLYLGLGKSMMGSNSDKPVFTNPATAAQARNRTNLLADSAGSLFFTGAGELARLNPPAPGATGWTQTILKRFNGPKHGLGSLGRVIADDAGTLYGVTSEGGKGACTDNHGCGIVFRLTNTGFVP